MKGFYFLTYPVIALLSYVDTNLGSDTIDSHTVNVTYEVRKKLNLTCYAPIKDNITVVWRKKGVLYPLAVRRYVLTDNSNYRIYRKEDAEVFQIITPSFSAAGIYECSFTIDRIYRNSTTFVVTRRGKQFTNIVTTKQSVKASVGKDVDLPCVVQRRHRNKVVWLDPLRHVITYGTKSLKSRFRISSGNHRRQWTLTIKRVRNLDFGHYTCMVSTDPVLSHVVVLKKQDIVHTSTSSPTSTTATSTIHISHDIRNVTTENLTGLIVVSVDLPKKEPNIGATYRHLQGSDTSQDHLILGLSLCGFILTIVFVAGCYAIHRMQKMTRRIIQQEIHLENTRMRRRERRLTSETQVYIGRQNEYSKQEKQEISETNINEGGSPLREKKARRPNPYCDPWSSNSDIIAAMNAAYNHREGTTNITTPTDKLCPEIIVHDKGINDPLPAVNVDGSCEDMNTGGDGMDISRGEGEGESRDAEMGTNNL